MLSRRYSPSGVFFSLALRTPCTWATRLFWLLPSPFAPWRCWLPSLTPVTYRCKLPGMRSVAALPQHEMRW
ncbi:hypothetical protein AW40_25430 [Kosakonia radicincitans UMEnt01/12]|nr:hypothetical protein AW40_25430 [Kosakonia radicincitans UMEnt01/12]